MVSALDTRLPAVRIVQPVSRLGAHSDSFHTLLPISTRGATAREALWNLKHFEVPTELMTHFKLTEDDKGEIVLSPQPKQVGGGEVRPGGCCSPRHSTPFNARHEARGLLRITLDRRPDRHKPPDRRSRAECECPCDGLRLVGDHESSPRVCTSIHLHPRERRSGRRVLILNNPRARVQSEGVSMTWWAISTGP